MEGSLATHPELTKVLHAIVDAHVGLGERPILNGQNISSVTAALDKTTLQSDSKDDVTSTEAFQTVVAQREQDLAKNRVVQASSFSQRSFRDFDWSLRLVMSSEQMAVLRVPMVQLKMTLWNSTTNKDEDVVVELDRTQFDELLKACDDISSVLETLRQR